jgi:hypothetical protein
MVGLALEAPPQRRLGDVEVAGIEGAHGLGEEVLGPRLEGDGAVELGDGSDVAPLLLEGLGQGVPPGVLAGARVDGPAQLGLRFRPAVEARQGEAEKVVPVGRRPRRHQHAQRRLGLSVAALADQFLQAAKVTFGQGLTRGGRQAPRRGQQGGAEPLETRGFTTSGDSSPGACRGATTNPV